MSPRLFSMWQLLAHTFQSFFNTSHTKGMQAWPFDNQRAGVCIIILKKYPRSCPLKKTKYRPLFPWLSNDWHLIYKPSTGIVFLGIKKQIQMCGCIYNVEAKWWTTFLANFHYFALQTSFSGKFRTLSPHLQKTQTHRTEQQMAPWL